MLPSSHNFLSLSIFVNTSFKSDVLSILDTFATLLEYSEPDQIVPRCLFYSAWRQ